MIQWDKQYEIGIDVIDEQHKKLIEITSQLSELLENAQDGEDIYDDMVRIINELAEYTIYHFRYEELLFEKYNYEFKESHIIEHNKLIHEIQSLDLEAIDEDQITYGKKLLKFLISWIFSHIMGSDFLYKDTLCPENNLAASSL